MSNDLLINEDYKLCDLPYPVLYSFRSACIEYLGSSNVEVKAVDNRCIVTPRGFEIPANSWITGQIIYVVND